jgi:hypothetical protein
MEGTRHRALVALASRALALLTRRKLLPVQIRGPLFSSQGCQSVKLRLLSSIARDNGAERKLADYKAALGEAVGSGVSLAFERSFFAPVGEAQRH